MAKSRIPKFKNDQEAAEFWDTHSVLDYLDEFEVVKDVKFVRPRKEVVSLRLDRPIVEALRRLAHKKGIGYSPLVRMWLVERLQQEMSRAKTVRPKGKAGSLKAA